MGVKGRLKIMLKAQNCTKSTFLTDAISYKLAFSQDNKIPPNIIVINQDPGKKEY